MELPYLTLFLRRLQAPLTIRSLRGISAWPRAQLIAPLAVFPLLALLMKVLTTPLLMSVGLNGQLLAYSILPPYAAVIGLLSCGWAYTAGAAQMQLLWSELGLLPKQQGLRQVTPEWYGAALSDAAAVGGVLAAGVWAMLPPLAGGAWGLLILALNVPTVDGAHLLHSFLVWILSLLDVTRIPHFLLASACLVLAFRRHWLRPLIPFFCGAVAALHWLLGPLLMVYPAQPQAYAGMVVKSIGDLVLHFDKLTPMAPRVYMLYSPVWLAPLLLVFLWFSLRDASLQRGSIGMNRFMALLFVLVPNITSMVLAILRSGAGPMTGENYMAQLVPSMFAAGAWFASTIFVMPGAWLAMPDGDVMQLQLMGWKEPAESFLLIMWWALTMWFWWRLAITCLHAARSTD